MHIDQTKLEKDPEKEFYIERIRNLLNDASLEQASLTHRFLRGLIVKQRKK